MASTPVSAGMIPQAQRTHAAAPSRPATEAPPTRSFPQKLRDARRTTDPAPARSEPPKPKPAKVEESSTTDAKQSQAKPSRASSSKAGSTKEGRVGGHPLVRKGNLDEVAPDDAQGSDTDSNGTEFEADLSSSASAAEEVATEIVEQQEHTKAEESTDAAASITRSDAQSAAAAAVAASQAAVASSPSASVHPAPSGSEAAESTETHAVSGAASADAKAIDAKLATADVSSPETPKPASASAESGSVAATAKKSNGEGVEAPKDRTHKQLSLEPEPPPLMAAAKDASQHNRSADAAVATPTDTPAVDGANLPTGSDGPTSKLKDAAPDDPSAAGVARIGVEGSVAPAHANAPVAAPAPAPPAPEARFADANYANIVTGLRTQLLPHGGTMQIRLDPPELGALQVVIEMKDGVVNATFRTSNDQATQLLGHSLGQLKTALEAQGVTVEKIQVQQSPRESHSSGEDAGRQQPAPQDEQRARQDQQRKETLQRMWRKLSGGSNPVDLVA